MFGNDLRSFPIAKTRNEGATGGKANLGNYSVAMGEVSFWLFVTGAIVGLLQSYRPIAFGAGYEMVDIAINLAKSGNFANPFVNVLTGSTAVEPPLYPIFLAMIITLLKLPILVKLAVVFLNICINALVAALLPRVSLLFFGDPIP